jgi:hypothetical protein
VLEDAKFLLSRGISLIPIKGRTGQTEEDFKKPVFSWKDYQTRQASLTELEEWFKFSRYNMAMVTGQVSRILTLDIDERHGGLESLKGKFVPRTWADRSPNGFHYHFLWLPSLNSKTTSVSNLLPGVDTRGNGGYVVIPPSVGHNGQSYTWVNNPRNTALAYPPPWLLSLLNTSPVTSPQNKSGWIAEALTSMAEGNRNNTFAKVVGRMWYDGWTEFDIFEMLKAKADEVSFPLSELDTVIKSISKKPRGTNETQDDEPSIDVNSFMDSSEDTLKWVVEGVVPEESVTILGGMQGLGKTWLMLDLAIELSRGGGSWLGKFLANSSRVLYVDEESSDRLLRSRLKKLLLAKGLNSQGLNLNLAVGKSTNFSNPNSVGKFKALLHRVQPQVVFIDSLVRVHKANENSSTEMAQVFSVIKGLVKEFKCSFFFADHEHKGIYNQQVEVDPSSNDLRGSNEKGAFADSVLSLRKKGADLFLYHTKSRHAEAQLPLLVRIEDLDEAKTKLAVRAYGGE